MPTARCEYWIAKVETASLAPNGADEYTRQSPAEDEERDTADDCQRNAVLCRRVRVFLALFAQTARNE